MSAYRNLLEPQAMAALFARHSPEGFSSGETEEGTPFFRMPYNLLTTLEPVALRKVRALPLYERWSGWLTFQAFFAGTTVSEYALFPAGRSAQEIVDGIVKEGEGSGLIVIKDVPAASPLLPEADNAFAAELADAARRKGFMDMEGQALAYVPVSFGSVQEYLERLSASRRKDLRRKLKKREQLTVTELPLGDARFFEPELVDQYYALYLEVFRQSEIHFDLLTRDFFAALLQSSMPGVVMCYHHGDTLAGYNICLVHDGRLVDKYIGLHYPLARELNLYFISWFVNLEYALKNGLHTYVAGWTDPEVKAGLGAQFTFTRHLARMGNPLLRKAVLPFRRFFEGDGKALEKR